MENENKEQLDETQKIIAQKYANLCAKLGDRAYTLRLLTAEIEAITQQINELKSSITKE
jgi:hypothetical protein